MNASEYRREYAAHCSAVERERYRRHAGLSSEPETERIRERFAHLWRREEVEDLRRAWEETPEDFTTERAGLRALTNAAREGFVKARAEELSGELSRCEERGVEWAGERVPAEDVQWRVATERDASRRRELSARLLDSTRRCDDLSAERLASRHDSARALGFDHYLALREEVAGASFETLADGADIFLRRTSSRYGSLLSEWATRALPPTLAGAPDYADAHHLNRLTHLDAFFPARELRATYEAALSALGIRVGSQKSVRVDDEARPLKKAQTACFGVNPPEEVWLVVGAREGGASLFRNFFAQAGRAQFYAWASRELAARHPEFVHAPDGAAREGYGILLRRLFTDEVWLGEQRGLKGSEAREAARACALAELYEARLCGARVRYALSLAGAAAAYSEQLGETYTSLHTEATSFRYHAATKLVDADEAFRAAESWRACLFAAALGEYLRARHGRRWWASRKAGDELIDAWNTASRYTAEELARLVGAGELEPELLAESLLGSAV